MEGVFEGSIEPANTFADIESTEDAPVIGAENHSSPADSAKYRVPSPPRAEYRKSPGEGARVITTPEDDSSEWEALESAISYELRRVFPIEEEERLKTWAHIREVLIQGLDSGAMLGKEYTTSEDEAMACILTKGISHANVRSTGAVKQPSERSIERAGDRPNIDQPANPLRLRLPLLSLLWKDCFVFRVGWAAAAAAD